MSARGRRLFVLGIVAPLTLAGACQRGSGGVVSSRSGPPIESPVSPTPAAAAVPQERVQKASELMLRFAERTGLTGDRPQKRYLWTDAFAVCNFLGLAAASGEKRYAALALHLVDEVHHTLGRHRADDPRAGWISGLSEQEGEAHPTRGGLRIGKKLPERRVREPIDERLEWDRDGQYFHYLTKWMHALNQVARSTGNPVFNEWARELAETAQDGFGYQPPGGDLPRMYWKMSIDLSRPLVPSMGHHDPLDGYVTSVELRATAVELSESVSGPRLDRQAAWFASLVEGRDLTTTDPLGLGGLMTGAYRVEQLMRQGVFPDDELLEKLLASALAGLEAYARGPDLSRPAARRLAFRELGLALGLHAVARMWQAAEHETKQFAGGASARRRLEALMRHAELRKTIESFWLEPEHQTASTWTGHLDINEVMLATCLVPEGFLVLPRAR